MGILDAPAIQPGSEAAATFLAKLALGVENVVVAMLGDSTNVFGSNPWTLRVANQIAAMFPAYTVVYKLWSDGGQAYDAGTILHTGTGTLNGGGPFTLTFYNGGVGGTTAGYPNTNITRFNAMIPVAPDLIFVNYSHNSSGATGDFYRSVHYPILRNIQATFPKAGIVSIAQNPRASTDAEFTNGLNRCSVVKTLSANEGIGIVNVTDAYLATPNYASTLLVGDGIHPSDAGMALWAGRVMAHLRASLSLVGRTPQAPKSRIFIPAKQLDISLGSPALVNANNSPAWSLPADADSGVSAMFEIPSNWLRYGVYIIWTTQSETQPSGQNTVMWRSYTKAVGVLGRSEVNMEGSVSGAGNWGANQGSPVANGRPTSAGLGQWSITTIRIVTDVTPSTVLGGVEIRRIGTDAADTLTIGAQLLGLLIVRES